MCGRRLFVAACFILPVLAEAAPQPNIPVKVVQKFADRNALSSYLRSLGYKTRGGVDRDASDRDEREGRSFPHFSSSFTVGGVTYPFTMVGYPPRSGRASYTKSVIIPLRMNFYFFGPNQDINASFEPGPAVSNMVASPLYQPAVFPNGVGQFVDQMQRAAFWNLMDSGHEWHVAMAQPKVVNAVDIYVTPETGNLSQDSNGNLFGDVLIDFVDAQIRTILQFLDVDADTLPIFVTDNVTAQALGFHNAYALNASGTKLQTYIYTSWLDPALVDPLFADVSTFNHELAEWTNDPFINNVVPTWAFPPPSDPNAVCSGSNVLEVGDPQGNGPTYADFPTAVVTLKGVDYHLQQLVLWQWFTDEVPSSAFDGWYTFPIPSSLTVPAVYCQ